MSLYESTIVSPFENNEEASSASAVSTATPATLDLTYDNVEAVLDEMRPYLIQDGGNVVIQEIDGPVVKLELQVSSSKLSLFDTSYNSIPGCLWHVS